MITEETMAERLSNMPKSVCAALLRIGRRIGEGFEGEIVIGVKHGGVNFIRWTQNETGDVIKGELSQ